MRTFAPSAFIPGLHHVGPPRLVRGVMPAVATFVATLGLIHGGGHSGGGARSVSALAVVLAAVACLPLVLRRRAPLAVFAVCAVGAAALAASGHPQGPPPGAAVALLLLAADRPTRDRLETVAAVVLGMLGVYIAGQSVGADGFSGAHAVGAIATWGGAWIVGEQVRQRRQRFADAGERARAAARDREREGRLAAAEERTRIARDLHDSAAHSISVILVQAGAARLLQGRDPEAVRKALATIEDVARETITEIDRLVRGLRAEDAQVGDVEPPAGLAAVATLVERQRAAGNEVGVRMQGERRPLAPRLDQAAFRIVQEALTNAARHGSGAAAVAIAFGDDAFELIVENEIGAPTASADTDGHAIAGAPEASDGRAAVERVRALKPDIVLMDVRMPDLDGIAATREVLAMSPEVKVVILTTFDDDAYIFGALRAGASGFLLKRTRPEDLLAAVHTVAAGDSLLSPSVTRVVIDRVARGPAPVSERSDELEELTAREREVLELIARGMSNREIAAALVIEESTVKTHIKRILMKLHLRDRVQAVIFAYENGVTGRPRS